MFPLYKLTQYRGGYDFITSLVFTKITLISLQKYFDKSEISDVH